MPRTFDFHPRSKERPCAVNVVIAYAGLPARELATRVCQNLCRRLYPEFRFRSTWWDFESFQQPHSMQAAVRAAVRAHLIFCSVDDCGALAGPAKQWFDSWLARKRGADSALVALIRKPSRAPAGTSSVEEYFRQVAYAARMDFFVHEFVTNGCPVQIANRAAVGVMQPGPFSLSPGAWLEGSRLDSQ